MEKDSPMFFNPMLFEGYVTHRQWMKAKEYLLKFFSPEDKILSSLAAIQYIFKPILSLNDYF